jgi:anti-sigma factor RsiW
MNDSHSESERLRAYYAQLSEEELVHIGSQYESLTEAAQSAIRAEFDRRGMPAPELADTENSGFQPLVTIRQYRDPAGALIAKATLDAAGIFAFLQNENTVRMDWLWSNLMGGIRLQVRPEDQAAAEEVLSPSIPPIDETDGVN